MAATLADELVEEILIRIPPEEPAHLVHAALVCKTWRRILCDHGFIRRYRRFHGTPPLLGYFQNFYGGACFFDTSTASPVSEAALLSLKSTVDCSSYSAALDCRHGRVLIHFPHNRDQLMVWDPITSGRQQLSLPPYIHHLQPCTGSVLCATKACDHLDCGGGPFFVVFVWKWIAVDGMNIQASIYSSETSAWSTLTSIDINCYIHTTPGLLTGDALYFTVNIHERLGILKYDLCKHGLSVIDVPVPRGSGIPLVIKGEDRELLQLATLSDNCIYMWSQKDVTNGIHDWVKNKVMDLTPLLPELGHHTRARKVIGFAEGTDIIFISTSTYEGIITLNLKSRQVRKVCDRNTYTMSTILPYMGFCTPR